MPMLSKKEQECSIQDRRQLVVTGKASFVENPRVLGMILQHMNDILGDVSYSMQCTQ